MQSRWRIDAYLEEVYQFVSFSRRSSDSPSDWVAQVGNLSAYRANFCCMDWIVGRSVKKRIWEVLGQVSRSMEGKLKTCSAITSTEAIQLLLGAFELLLWHDSF